MVFFSYSSFGLDAPAKLEGEDGGSFPTYDPVGREEIPIKEKMLNFGAMYGVQWAFYLYSQEEEIRKDGSLENWLTNPFGPRFDKDSFEYNIFKHSLTGNYYYLWYRSRNYNEKDAFFWSFMSSLAFEFTIETVTEVPSYQDIYQTPVFGAVLGIGSEKLSKYLHAKNTWYWHTLGYIINPMTLIPQFAREKKVAAMPLFDKNKIGALVTWEY
jgi:hypothetical protein